ncbi:MAG: peptidylprolyl isomerase [bacterium]|nr:peptidylprolyl isomerase [bacterium]
MFDALRKMILPIIIIVLFFFVGMIILQWGLDITNRQQSVDANMAGMVNGEEISWVEFNRVYNNLVRNESKNYEEEIPDQRLAELRNTAWNQLLHDHLVLQEVNKHNMIVTDEELYAFLRLSPPPDLQGIPDFQTNGQFDYQKYVQAMANPQLAPFWANVENAVKPDILKLKLQEMVIQTAHVTEPEIKEFFVASNEKVKVGVINVGFERFSRPPPKSTEEEMEVYFNEHKEDFTLDARSGLNIVLVEKKAAPYDWEQSYNRITAIQDSIKAGADFAEMAKQYSEDGSASQGGDLGLFPRGQMVEAFDKKVFSMNPGDISDPVRTQFGWHLILLHEFEDVKEVPRGKTEEETIKKAHASHILIKTTASQETLDQNYKKAEEFLAAARSDGFLKAAEDIGLAIRKTALFFTGGNIQYIGSHQEADEFAFNNEPGAISGLMENNSSYFVAEVAERHPSGVPSFDLVRDKVNQDLQKYKVIQLCTDTANAIYAEIQAGDSFKEAAKKHDDEYKELDPFGRGQFVDELRRDPKAIGAAFGLANPGDYTPPILHGQGVVIIKLLEKITPDLTEFTAKRDSIGNAILNNKQQELYGRWFQNLMENSEIENYTNQSTI